MGKVTSNRRIKKFAFAPGVDVAGKYRIVAQLGTGWEGEVYMLRERTTGIERAAKFFFPHRNRRNRTSTFYAKKLHKLRHCPVVIQYHTHETILFQDQPVHVLISEFVEGELLSRFVARQPGHRLSAFQGLHLLYALAAGIEPIHYQHEYHGDLHDDNIIVRRYGLSFDLKLVDMFHWGPANPENIHEDVVKLIRVFFDSIGGAKHYPKHPPEIKAICCGLKRSLILKRFRNAGQIRQHLETMQWQ